MNFQNPVVIWEATGDFLQSKWESVLEIIGHDPFDHYVTITIIMSIIVFWVIGGLFTFMDVTKKPVIIQKYKVQPGTNEPIDKEKLRKVIINVIINQTIIASSIAYLFYKIGEKFQGFPSHQELPTFLTIFSSLIFFTLIREFVAYYTHRSLHYKYFYKFIHKKHHEWTAPISLTATYCHPIEHIVNNLLPIAVGPTLLNSHIITRWIWYTISIALALSDHSGYNFKFLPTTAFHDYHHLKFNQCFGTIGIMDRLHNTDQGYRKSIKVTTKKASPEITKKKSVIN